MLRQIIAPIHPDGWKFVAIGVVATLVLFLIWRPVGLLALILTLWIIYFFRDPWRVTPMRPGLVISPADGTIVSIAPALPPPELEMGAEPLTRIGIFLNLFDVHVARSPRGTTRPAVSSMPASTRPASITSAWRCASARRTAPTSPAC